MPVNLGGPETCRRLGISDHGTVLNTADCELHELPTVLEKVNFKDIKGVGP